ncbi:MAG: NAD(P)H-binding protein [Anaeromyxobacter sp.]
MTGATGFLGGALAARLARDGGGPVRCLVRPGTAPERLRRLQALGPAVEVVPCRLDNPAGLRDALQGAAVLHHAAAAKLGPPAALVVGAAVATGHLFRAALAAGVARVVLVSSFSVLGVAGLGRGAVVDEQAPLEPHPERRDAYCFAKLRQEQLAWRLAREQGLPLTVVRPGAVFGEGQPLLGSRLGLRLGGLFLHLGGRCLVPLTYVENCAEAIALAGTAPGALGAAIHVVDDGLPTSRALLARYRREVEPLRVIPLPGPLLGAAAWLNAWYSARTANHLPPVLTPYKAASLWRPLRYSSARARALLGWAPRVPMAEALDRTFAALARAAAPPRAAEAGPPAAPRLEVRA